MKTPITDKAFQDAREQNMPEFGEGWEGFVEDVKQAMGELEVENTKLREVLEKFRVLLEQGAKFQNTLSQMISYGCKPEFEDDFRDGPRVLQQSVDKIKELLAEEEPVKTDPRDYGNEF